MRIRAIMIAVVIFGLVTALVVRDRQARHLQVRLRALEAEMQYRAYLADLSQRADLDLILELQDRKIAEDAAKGSPHESNP
jgi:hypothetical protein